MIITIDKKPMGGWNNGRRTNCDYNYIYRDEYFLSIALSLATDIFQTNHFHNQTEDYSKMFASNISIRDGEYTKVIYTLVTILILRQGIDMWTLAPFPLIRRLKSNGSSKPSMSSITLTRWPRVGQGCPYSVTATTSARSSSRLRIAMRISA